jgi:hypothetical protein
LRRDRRTERTAPKRRSDSVYVLRRDLGALREAMKVAVADDSTFWVPDEYRPAIYHFSKHGRLLERFVPIGTRAAAGEPTSALCCAAELWLVFFPGTIGSVQPLDALFDLRGETIFAISVSGVSPGR